MQKYKFPLDLHSKIFFHDKNHGVRKIMTIILPEQINSRIAEQTLFEIGLVTKKSLFLHRNNDMICFRQL